MAAGRRAASRPRRQRPDTALRLLTLPTVALVLAVGVAPLLYIARLSLYSAHLGGAAPVSFAGWSNYLFALSDSSVAASFRNTGYFAALSVAVAVAAGLGIALLIDSDAGRAGQWLIPAVVLPWAVPEIVNALVWQWIYSPTYGALNGALVGLHLARGYRAWLSTPASAMHAVIVAYSWKLVPFVVLVLYAALRSIPVELYDCAQLDGANRWTQFRFIAWPFLLPVLAVAVLFTAVWSMRAFDIVYLLTGGGPGEATMLLSYFTFAKAFQFADLGGAAAVACLLVVMTLALTAVYWTLLGAGETA